MALLIDADVAKLVDALDLGSSAARRESSSLFPRTTFLIKGLREVCGLRARAWKAHPAQFWGNNPQAVPFFSSVLIS